MGTQEDLALIRRLVEPLANKAGLFRRRVLGMVTEENIKEMYQALGEDTVRQAAEAIIRIGQV